MKKNIKTVTVLYLVCILANASFANTKCLSLFPIKIDGKWGFINCNGKEVVKPTFLSKPFFKDGSLLLILGLRKPTKRAILFLL